MDDVALVLDTVGSQRTAFFGTTLGDRLALLFAATYPSRTSAVVAHASHPASLRDEDFPWGSRPRATRTAPARLQDGSVDPTGNLHRVAPQEAADPSFRQWWRMFSLSATTALGPMDVRRLLGDRRWHRLLEEHQQVLRHQLGRFRGRGDQDDRGWVPGHL